MTLRSFRTGQRGRLLQRAVPVQVVLKRCHHDCGACDTMGEREVLDSGLESLIDPEDISHIVAGRRGDEGDTPTTGQVD